MASFFVLLQFQAQFVLDSLSLEETLPSDQDKDDNTKGYRSQFLFHLPLIFQKSHEQPLKKKRYRFLGDLALQQEQRAQDRLAFLQKQQQSNLRFIIFLPIQAGQGLGNIVSGLLAAHLLGEEFNRIVCVSPVYFDFVQMFHPVNPKVIQYCPDALRTATNMTPSYRTRKTIRLVNFEHAPDECDLQRQLQSGPDILFMVSNTYPRWPKIPQSNYFSKYYRPSAELLQGLPWKTTEHNASDADILLDGPPTTVVHLRQPDGAQDARKGLDEQTLEALGDALPRNTTYLVTNRVSFYDYFERNYGWKHPNWNTVIHSALHKQWGSREEMETNQQDKQHHNHHLRRHEHDALPFQSVTVSESKQERDRQALQMWVDWYTISQAKKVYHTHSDFSISAIHWNDIRDSKSIQGYDSVKRKLMLNEESWRVDGETAPLVERTEIASGTTKLRKCGHPR
jgi:hypothetical protein